MIRLQMINYIFKSLPHTAKSITKEGLSRVFLNRDTVAILEHLSNSTLAKLVHLLTKNKQFSRRLIDNTVSPV